MVVDQQLEKYITPYLFNSFGDAEAILLCGSQARLLNGQGDPRQHAKKNSDYDFILLYRDLPARFPAAQFASRWMDIPGMDEPVSIDLKIVDYDYLRFHARHTREVRRFPFLFSMIGDAYPLMDKNGIVPTLKEEAKIFIADGPAPLSVSERKAFKDRLDSLEKEIAKAGMDSAAGEHVEDPRVCQVLALEGLHALSHDFLKSASKWTSPIGRNLEQMNIDAPEKVDEIISSFNNAAMCRPAYSKILQDIRANLPRDAAPPDSSLLQQNIAAFVTQEEKEDSDRKGAKIMIGQYLARLKDNDNTNPVRISEVKSVLWTAMKNYLAQRVGTPTGFGVEAADAADQAFGKPALKEFFTALQADDVPKMYEIANDVLSDQGGVSFNYLERIYVEDLARRRENCPGQPRTATFGYAKFFKNG